MRLLPALLAALLAAGGVARADDPGPAVLPPAPAVLRVYRAVPEGQAAEARPFRLYLLLEVTAADAPAPVQPPRPVDPPPPVAPPPPSPEAAEVLAAARAYGRAVPYAPALAAAFRELAGKAAEFNDLNEVVAAVGTRRRALGDSPGIALAGRLGAALDRVARAGCDADGVITDSAAVARALTLAAEGLELATD